MKILVADDHELVRHALIDALKTLDEIADISDTGIASDIIPLLENQSFDLIVLDLFMPEADGFELTRKICNSYPQSKLVILSSSDDAQHMRKALDLGASGYITKASGISVMISALQLVLSGGIYVPPDIMNVMNKMDTRDTRDTRAPDHLDMTADSNQHSHRDVQPSNLTARQKEVLDHLVEGLSNKEIARNLGLAENTVKIHVAALLKHLGVNNRTKAVVAAKELGFI